MFQKKIFSVSNLYVFGLVLIAIGLPLTKILMSVGQFAIAGVWLFSGDYKIKFKRLFQNKIALCALGIFLLHIIWLFNTTNYSYAFNDIRIKLPLLIIPFVVGSFLPLEKKQLAFILQFFIAAIFVATLISMAIWLGLTSMQIDDIREISPFISHIRFSLLICVAIFGCYYLFKQFKGSKESWFIAVYPLLIIWMVLFLFILKALTGLVILFLTLLLLFTYYVIKSSSYVYKIVVFSVIISSVVFVVYYVNNIYSTFYKVEKVDYFKLDKKTIHGNLYRHYYWDETIENGKYVNLYICEKELNEVWDKLSVIPYKTGFDANGSPIKYTIVRYLTSKGLRKDAEGLKKLRGEDVRNIEAGVTNYLYPNSNSINARLYEIIWEYDIYTKRKDANGHSITMRVEFMKTGLNVLKENFWLGVGTGDVNDEFQLRYNWDESGLGSKYRLRTHNQFITFAITFGIIGFVLFMLLYLYPLFISVSQRNFLFTIFYIIATLSFLNEDTLETQAGVTFFAFFFAIFTLTKGQGLKE